MFLLFEHPTVNDLSELYRHRVEPIVHAVINDRSFTDKESFHKLLDKHTRKLSVVKNRLLSFVRSSNSGEIKKIGKHIINFLQTLIMNIKGVKKRPYKVMAYRELLKLLSQGMEDFIQRSMGNFGEYPIFTDFLYIANIKDGYTYRNSDVDTVEDFLRKIDKKSQRNINNIEGLIRAIKNSEIKRIEINPNYSQAGVNAEKKVIVLKPFDDSKAWWSTFFHEVGHAVKKHRRYRDTPRDEIIKQEVEANTEAIRLSRLHGIPFKARIFRHRLGTYVRKKK